MFWRKVRATSLNDNSPDLLALVTKLGMERRQNVRVRYPQSSQVCKLPTASLNNVTLKILDISLGGCCLWDPQNILGPSVGHELQIDMHWSSGVEPVPCRLVSRVDHKRHIQFFNLSAHRQSQMRKSMTMGVRGLSVRPHLGSTPTGPKINVAEMWSSPIGDGVVLQNQQEASLHFQAEQFSISYGRWPLNAAKILCSKVELEQMVLFLANIPVPSPGLNGLLAMLEDVLRAGKP